MNDWTLKSANTIGDRCELVFARTITGPDGQDLEETATIWHERTSFGGSLQTVANWKANIKREVAVELASLNAAKQLPPRVDITADVAP